MKKCTINYFSITKDAYVRPRGSDYTDAIHPFICQALIYGAHHFRAGGQAGIIPQGLHWLNQCWPLRSEHDGHSYLLIADV